MFNHVLVSVSELDLEYSDRDDSAQMDDEEFWTEEPNRRREGNMVRLKTQISAELTF